MGTLAGTATTILHGNASGLPTFSSVVGADLAANISISTTGTIATTGTGTVTSAGLLTASNGLTVTTGAINLTGTSGAIALSGLSASSITTGNTNSFSITTGTTGALTLDSGTTGNVNLGTGANAKTVTIGNGTTTSAVAINTGTGGFTVLTGTSGNVSIASGSTGSVTLDSGTTGAVNLGTNANAKAIAIGNTTGATSLTLSAGSAGIVTNGLRSVANGNLQVCVNNGTKLLYIGGSATSCNTSSIRYKHDVETINLGLETIHQLRPVSYRYNDSDIPALGFIAEEINTIDSRPVVFDEEGRPNALDYNQFIPILTKGIQELDEKVMGLESTVAQTTISTASSELSLTEETVASLVAKMIQNVFKSAVEFFSDATFHADIFLRGRLIVHKDSAGFAVIEKGGSDVHIIFDRAYDSEPVIVVTPYESVGYAVLESGVNGFVIRLDSPADHDVRFSWTAQAVADVKTAVGSAASTPAPLPSSSPASTLSTDPSSTLSSTSTPTPTAAPSPETAPALLPSETPAATASGTGN